MVLSGPTEDEADEMGEKCIVSTTLAEIENSEGSLPSNASLPRTPMDPIPISVPFPTKEITHDSMMPPRPLHNRAASSSSASTLRPRSAVVDPYTAYARRSNSLLFTPAHPHRKMYTEGDETGTNEAGSKDEGEWVMPMIRSRAPSTDAAGASVGGQLIRTLSIGGLSKLGEKAVIEGLPAITQADLPASALPSDFRDGAP